MKAWKKMMALVLTLGFVAGFAACGGDKGGDNSSSSSSEAVAAEPEQITEMQMSTLIRNLSSITNLTVTGTKLSEENKSVRVSFTADYADGKAYQVTTVTDAVEAETTYAYLGKENDTFYTWYSMDNETWSKTELPAEVEITSVTAEYAFASLLPYINYAYYEYNAVTGMNIYTNWGVATVSVKVVDGKIVEYEIEDANPATRLGVIESATITYGNATVGELPSVSTEAE